jgi:hypothetical protein
LAHTCVDVLAHASDQRRGRHTDARGLVNEPRPVRVPGFNVWESARVSSGRPDFNDSSAARERERERVGECVRACDGGRVGGWKGERRATRWIRERRAEVKGGRSLPGCGGCGASR